MSTLTMQRFFTETVDYLRTQTRCVNDAGGCVYEDGAGNHCAIGYWIPAGHKALTSTEAVGDLSANYPDLAGVAWPDTGHGLDLARNLQQLHDRSELRGFGCRGLSRKGELEAVTIAARFGLELAEEGA
jgi:hypothetical protein